MRAAIWLVASLSGVVVVTALGARAYLTPARLTPLVANMLAGQLKGSVHVGEVSWRLPLILHVERVAIGLDAHAAPDLTFESLEARLHVSALLRRRVVVGPVALVRPFVHLHPIDANHPEQDALSAALSPRNPAPPDPDAQAFDWPIALSDVRILDGKVSIEQPGAHVVLSGLDLDCRRALVQTRADDVHIEADAGLDIQHVSLTRADQTPAQAVRLGPVHLGLKALGVEMRDAHVAVAAHSAEVRLPEAHLAYSGRATLQTPVTGSRADGRLTLYIDTHSALWPQLVGPQTWNKLAPAGAVTLELLAKTAGSAQTASFSTTTQELSVIGTGIDGLSGGLRWQAGALDLTDVTVRTPGGALVLAGQLVVDAASHVAHHDLRLRAETLPVRALLQRALPDVAPLMPSRLDADVRSAGEALWPELATQLSLSAHAAFDTQPKASFLPPDVALSAEATIDKDAVTLTRLVLEADGAKLALSGRSGFLDSDAIGLHAALEAPEPSRTLARLLPGWHADDAVVHLDVFGTRRKPSGTLECRVKALRQGLGRAGQVDVVVPARLNHGVVRIANATMQGDALQASLMGQATLQTADGTWRAMPDVDAEVRVGRAHLKTLAPAAQVHGDLTLNAHVSGRADRPHMAGLLRVVGLATGPLDFREATLQLFGDGTRIGIRQMVLSPKQGGHIFAHGLLSPQTGGIDIGIAAHDVPAAWLGLKTPTPAMMQLTASAQGTLDGIDARLEAEAGRVLALSADAHVETQPGILRLDVQGHGALESLAEWLEGAGALRGEMALALHADGAFDRPNLAVRLAGDGLHWGAQPLGNTKLRLETQTSRPGVYATHLDAMDLMHIDAVTRTIGGLAVDANARFEALRAGALVAGLAEHGNDATLTGTAQAHWAAQGPKHAEQLSATLDIARVDAKAAGRTIALKKPWHLELDDMQVTASELLLGGTAGNLAAHGRVTGPWREKTPEAGANTQLKAMAEGVLDLNFVAALAPALGHAQGDIAWSGAVSGSLEHPVGTGSLRVDKEWTLRPRGTLVEVHVARGEVRLTRERLSLHAIEGTLESGTFALGGHIDLEGLTPKAYQIHLSASDLPVHTPDLVLEANVVADATGDGLLPLVKGRIDITRGRFLKKLEFKDFNFVNAEPDTSEPLGESAPWLRDLHLDLLATSQNGVEIRLDAGAFAVDATLQTDLHITGTALVPHVAGRINAERGSLHFPKADLQLTQAQLDFEPTPKDPLGAALSVQADGEVTPSSGGGTGTQTYSIALRVDGPIKELQFDLTSDQGLGKLEILSLLTTGHASIADLTSGTSDDGAQLDAALAFAGSQVSGPLTSLAERQLERALNLRLELNAEVTQENVRLTAAKNLNRRLRLEGAYTHGISAEQNTVSTRAQLSLTDKLLLEGTAARDLSGAASSGTTGNIQSNVELKYRLVGH